MKKKKLSRGQEHKNQQHTKIDANDETKKKSGRFVSLDNTEGHKKIYANIFTFYARTQKLYWSPDKFQSGINRFSKLLLSKKWYTLESQIEDIKTVFHSLTRIFNDF